MSGTVNPLSYTGIDPKKQPKFFTDLRAPTLNDFLSFELGDQWLDKSSSPPTLYILVSVSNNIGLWKLIGTSSSAGIGRINGVSPDGGGDFSITAGNNIAVTQGVNSISIASSGGGTGFVDLIPNSGTSPVVYDGIGQITLVGSGSMTTVGGLNTLTVDLTGLTNHAVLVGAGTPTITKLAVGSNGQVLIGASTADPAFSTLTSADGSIAFTTGPNTLGLVVAGGTTVGKTITGDAGGGLPPTAGNWNILGGSVVAGTSPIATSGSGSALTINAQISQALAAPDATKIGISNFDSTDFTVDDDGFVEFATTGAGKTITGDTGGALSPTANNWNILGGTGTSISGSGSTLTINSTAGGLGWTIITVDQTAVVNNGYICNKASALELLLPATAVAGDIIRVSGVNSVAGIKITQNASQQIHFGNASTTSGVAGFAQSTSIRDSLEIVAVVGGSSTIWNVLSSVGSWNLA